MSVHLRIAETGVLWWEPRRKGAGDVKMEVLLTVSVIGREVNERLVVLLVEFPAISHQLASRSVLFIAILHLSAVSTKLCHSQRQAG